MNGRNISHAEMQLDSGRAQKHDVLLFGYTKGEEIANSITHGIGAALSVAAMAVLVTLASIYGDSLRIVCFSIYGASLVLLYLTSTLYHSFRNPRIKSVFKLLDHSAIFLLIAGTYTPFILVCFEGAKGWLWFGLIWALAIIGILLKVFVRSSKLWLSVGLYLLMGWLSLFIIGPIWQSLPVQGLVWLAIGGAFYTLGVVFYLWKSLPFNHMIWHLFVVGGSVSHFIGILWFALPELFAA